MEIKLYKDKHQIPQEAVKNIPFDDKEEYQGHYPSVHEGKISEPCFVKSPSVYVPNYVEPFILNQIKKEFSEKRFEVIPSSDHGFYSLNEGGFYFSLFVGGWSGRLEKSGTREKGLLFKRKLNIYRSIPSRCSLEGDVEFEKFEGVNPKSILNILSGFGFNCKVKSTPKQVEEMLKKSAPPSASDIASEVLDEKERREYERSRIWP